jgi:hypothetical protein
MKKQQPTNGRSWLMKMEHPHLKITAGNLLIPTVENQGVRCKIQLPDLV